MFSNFVFRCICCFLIYLTIMMLVNVKLDFRGYQRIIFHIYLHHNSQIKEKTANIREYKVGNIANYVCF